MQLKMQVVWSELHEKWLSAKEELNSCLVFVKSGDFLETFDNDAILVSEKLGTTLLSRSFGDNVKISGFPYFSHQTYLDCLVNLGYKVVIIYG